MDGGRKTKENTKTSQSDMKNNFKKYVKQREPGSGKDEGKETGRNKMMEKGTGERGKEEEKGRKRREKELKKNEREN